MHRKIVLLHYRYVPAVAGVELVLEQHARLLADAGDEVVVLAASGVSRDARVKVVLLPELARGFDAGVEGAKRRAERDERAVQEAVEAMQPWCEWADAVLVHNVLTMPFALPCTVALWRLANELPAGRVVNWVHDLAAMNPDYAASFPLRDEAALAHSAEGGAKVLRETLDAHDAYDVHLAHLARAEKGFEASAAWLLLSRRHPKMRVVAISEWRAEQFWKMTGEKVEAVVPDGIDPVGLLGLSDAVAQFARRERLLDPTAHDVVLLQPARVLRRKNIELGIELVAALRERGCRARLLVTAAPDGHNPASVKYHEELLALRVARGVEREVCFVSEFFPVTRGDLVGLYSVSDVLWFPSRQEGFGLPLLEGMLHRMLVFCADVPPMNAFGLSSGEFFDPEGDPGAVAEQLLTVLREKAPLLHARREVLMRFAWDAVWPRLDALLRGGAISPG